MNSIDPIQTALSHYQAGCFQKTIDLCFEILKENPEHFEALQLLGLSRQGRQEYDQAILCFEEMIRYYPEMASGYFNLANNYYEIRKFDQAIANFSLAAQRDPTDGHIYNNWGTVLRETGEWSEAISCFQMAINLIPDYANAYHNLGNVLNDQGKIEGSIRCYQKAVQINPLNATHFKCLGNALRKAGKLEESLAILSEAFDRFPEDPEIYYSLGATLKAKGRFDEAEACYQKAIRMNPQLPEAYYNLGNVLKEKGQIEETKSQFQKALKLNPNFAEAYNNLGMIYKEAGELSQALCMFQKAWEARPGFAEAKWNMGLTSLLTGNFLDGWEGYEWRWKKPDYKKYYRSFSKPIWNGEDIAGRTILIHAEQGYGDTIQFVRYVPLVAVRTTRIYMECPRNLKRLLSHMEGVRQVIARGDPLPKFDVHCPLMTLPKVFGTTLESIPSENPYLKVEPDLKRIWKERINSKNSNFKVGLIWSGNPEHLNDRNRSIGLNILFPLFQIQNIKMFSLQKGLDSAEAKRNTRNLDLIDFTEHIRDFSDTAALIENLDLVISVDTAVAHLAGALGKKVWTLLPFSPDWRWLLGREDNPWYPTMRLYRQQKPGNWVEVIERVVTDLQALNIG